MHPACQSHCRLYWLRIRWLVIASLGYCCYTPPALCPDASSWVYKRPSIRLESRISSKPLESSSPTNVSNTQHNQISLFHSMNHIQNYAGTEGGTAPEEIVAAVACTRTQARQWTCACPRSASTTAWYASHKENIGRKCTTRTDSGGDLKCPICNWTIQGCDGGFEKHLMCEHDWVRQDQFTKDGVCIPGHYYHPIPRTIRNRRFDAMGPRNPRSRGA
jgi:hypothetical protein